MLSFIVVNSIFFKDFKIILLSVTIRTFCIHFNLLAITSKVGIGKDDSYVLFGNLIILVEVIPKVLI